MKTTNRVIHEAYSALDRIGEAEMPAMTGFKFSLVRNTLRPIFDALEEQRKKLVEKHEASPEHMTKIKDVAERRANVDSFYAEWNKLLDDETEWNNTCTIEAKKLQSVDKLRPNDLAALVVAGIIVKVNELPDE